MSDYTIHPLSDKEGNPITRDPYIPQLGDYMLVNTPDGGARSTSHRVLRHRERDSRVHPPHHPLTHPGTRTTMNENPMGREYTRGEWDAARRQGIARRTDYGGVLVWATGPWWPTEARERVALAQRDARDWELLANAMDREWQKPLPEPTI